MLPAQVPLTLAIPMGDAASAVGGAMAAKLWCWNHKSRKQMPNLVIRLVISGSQAEI